MSRKDKLRKRAQKARQIQSQAETATSSSNSPRSHHSNHDLDNNSSSRTGSSNNNDSSTSKDNDSSILFHIHDEPTVEQQKAALAVHGSAGSKGGCSSRIVHFLHSPYLNLSRDSETGDMVFGTVPDREYHEGFMRKAIEMAEMALRSDETPVGCVFVKDGEIIGRGINGTNATLNGTRHAEFVALAEIMSTHPQSVLKETDLYVTVEPCIMCASALRQYGIRTVYFGCLNDRFGGTGGVMTVNQDPGIDQPFNVYGGLFREEAIMLLRRFYVQENEKAPEPKPKKNRELKTAILPVNAPVTRAQPMIAVARALASAGKLEQDNDVD